MTEKITNEDKKILKELILKYGRCQITSICNQYDEDIWNATLNRSHSTKN